MSHENTKFKRRHLLWIVYSIGKSIKELLLFIAFLMAFISLNSGLPFIKFWKIIIAIYLIYRFLLIIVDWKNFKYLFTDEGLYINEGRFMKKKRFIPLERIQSFSQNTHFLYRILGLTSIFLEIGSNTDKSTIKIEMITLKEAERIKRCLNHIVAYENYKEKATQDMQISKTPLSSGQTTQLFQRDHYQITIKEILISSLLSLELLIVIPLFNEISSSNINNYISVDTYIDSIISFFETSWLLRILGIIMIVILSLIYGALKTYIQFGNFKVMSDNKQIYIQKGIFNRTEFIIPKNKVQAISINHNFLKALFGLAKVKIISINDMENKEMKMSNILFPIINRKKALLLLSEILPEFRIEYKMNPISKFTVFIKIIRTSYVWVLGGLIILYFWPKYWYMTVLLFIAIIASQIISAFYSRYLINGAFIQLQNGGLSTKLFITIKSNVEELRVTESMLQRKFGLASLQISTRAKPIHKTKIHDVPKEIAVYYYEWYARKRKEI